MPIRNHKLRILFLDVDGVMNTTANHPTNSEVFTRCAVESLREIVTVTGCEVVISSTWREDKMDRLHEVLKAHGLGIVSKNIIGSTPLLDCTDYPTREDEIDCWLHSNGWPQSLAILDDEPFAGNLKPWLVQTSCEIGLTKPHARRAIELLKLQQPLRCRAHGWKTADE